MHEAETSVELAVKFVIVIHIGISLNYDDAANSLFGVKLFSNADYDDIKVNSSLLDNFAFSDEDAKAFVNRLLKNSTFNS